MSESRDRKEDTLMGGCVIHHFCGGKDIQFLWHLLPSVANASQNYPCIYWVDMVSGAFIYSLAPLPHYLRASPVDTDSPPFQDILAGCVSSCPAREKTLRLKMEQHRVSL